MECNCDRIIDEAEFQSMLDNLCATNRKARAILEGNDGVFDNIPNFQQKLFLEKLGLERKNTVFRLASGGSGKEGHDGEK